MKNHNNKDIKSNKKTLSNTIKKLSSNKKQLYLLAGSLFILLFLIIYAVTLAVPKSKQVTATPDSINFTETVYDSSSTENNTTDSKITENDSNTDREIASSIVSNNSVSDNNSEDTVSSSVSDNSISDNSIASDDVSNEPPATDITDDSNANNTIANYDENTAYMLNLASGTILSEAEIDWNNLSKYFVSCEIPDNIISYINGKSYRENDNVALSDLRYIKLIHYNFNGNIQVGELIVNKKIASDITAIFKELFENKYEIQSMYLVDRYWTGDGESTDTASIDVNNTSSFLYRAATGSSKLSKHAYGMAIDINPQQNPYVSYKSGSPKWYHENANDYIDRDTGLAHVITHDDICFKIFKKYGFTWGGDWNTIKDYQHFEK